VQYIYNDTITFAGNHDPAFTLTIVRRPYSLTDLREDNEIAIPVPGKLGKPQTRTERSLQQGNFGMAEGAFGP
jgi:hypothetical protein